MEQSQRELTLEQAKEALHFQTEVLQQQTMEIGNLNTEKIQMGVQLKRFQEKIKELEKALQGMIDANNGQESAE